MAGAKTAMVMAAINLVFIWLLRVALVSQNLDRALHMGVEYAEI
jgi:hypothetical protein